MTTAEKIDFLGGYRAMGIRSVPTAGLPSVWMSDATSGPRCYGASTAFPSASALAATWNVALAREMGLHVAEAARAKGVSVLLGPGINIARVPTCGRNFEYMGEDPFLTGTVAAAYVAGAQKKGVICTVKHLAVNNSDYDRHKASSDLDDRTLREIYLRAFEMVVAEGAEAIMSAYNPINGVWASENRRILTEILREEWGFDGFVVSDWNSLYSTAGPIRAGLDLEMPQARWLTRKRVERARTAGEVRDEDIDGMVRNVLTTLFRRGVYDRPVKDPNARELHPDHIEAARRIASEVIVLLKNAGDLLPLKPEATVAVTGPMATDTETLGGGSCYVANPTGKTSILEGLRELGAEVVHAPGRRGQLLGASREAVRRADTVVVALGFDHVAESELYDRPWRLPAAQRRLIREAAVLNPRVVVTLTTGGGVETASWIDGVPAVLHTFFLGETVGTAIAEVFFGRTVPSGKLPMTMARRWKDIAATRYYPRRYWKTNIFRMFLGQGNPHFRRISRWPYGEGLMVGYRHFDTAEVEPAFPFGHGLSYTTFRIVGMELSAKVIGPEESVEVILQVRNTGNRDGAEVVQIYVADEESRLPRPSKELKGFAKVSIAAGAVESVTVVLDPRAFRYWDPDAGKAGAWVAEEGDFLILAGRSSRRIEAEERVTLRRVGAAAT
jgi:beta-glucosidase